MSPSLRLIVIKTKQVDLLCQFYAQVGIQFEREQHGNGPIHYSVTFGETVFEVYPLRAKDSTVDSTTRLGFGVFDLEKVVANVRLFGEQEGLGDIVQQSPKMSSWGRVARVVDPDGRVVELYESSDR